MKAVVLRRLGPIADHASLLEVAVCGVCHTELDEIEGRAPPPSLPVVLGHQVVGRARAVGSAVVGFDARPPGKLRAVIDTTPPWKPMLAALESLGPGGRLVANAIRKEYPLAEAGRALLDLRTKGSRGAKVLRVTTD